MPERVLAGCSYGGDCPGVRVQSDGDVAVTGALPDGSEATVVVPAGVFDQAARAWRRSHRGPWRRLAPRIVGWALAGLAVTHVAMDLGASSLVGHLAGLAFTLVACAVAGWREAGRDV